MTEHPARGACLCFVLIAMLATGCRSDGPPPQLAMDVNAGHYDKPRAYLQKRVDDLEPLWRGRLRRNEVLDRVRLGVVALADGDVRHAQVVLTDAFELLSTHGLNREKQLTYVFLNEDLRIWKGEPFEQAMAFHYAGLSYALEGSWDNLRAATLNALYHLEDYDVLGRVVDVDELERRAHRMELGQPIESTQPQSGYTPVQTDFALGYLMAGLAGQQMGRPQEAQDHLRSALRWAPQLQPVVDRMEQGDYNAVLVVDYGLGPVKVGAGPDGAIARFEPRTPGDAVPLTVRVADDEWTFPAAVDLNVLANDHKWNRYEALRVGKSTVGSVMIVGGAVAATSDSEEARWTGLGLILAGIFAKAGAHADLRYCDVLPQRVYVAPIRIPTGATPVTLRIGSGEPTALKLEAPRGPQARLRYIRLQSPPMMSRGVHP